jgi:hypothetical protein
MIVETCSVSPAAVFDFREGVRVTLRASSPPSQSFVVLLLDKTVCPLQHRCIHLKNNNKLQHTKASPYTVTFWILVHVIPLASSDLSPELAWPISLPELLFVTIYSIERTNKVMHSLAFSTLTKLTWTHDHWCIMRVAFRSAKSDSMMPIDYSPDAWCHSDLWPGPYGLIPMSIVIEGNP